MRQLLVAATFGVGLLSIVSGSAFARSFNDDGARHAAPVQAVHYDRRDHGFERSWHQRWHQRRDHRWDRAWHHGDDRDYR